MEKEHTILTTCVWLLKRLDRCPRPLVPSDAHEQRSRGLLETTKCCSITCDVPVDVFRHPKLCIESGTSETTALSASFYDRQNQTTTSVRFVDKSLSGMVWCSYYRWTTSTEIAVTIVVRTFDGCVPTATLRRRRSPGETPGGRRRTIDQILDLGPAYRSSMTEHHSVLLPTLRARGHRALCPG